MSCKIYIQNWLQKCFNVSASIYLFIYKYTQGKRYILETKIVHGNLGFSIPIFITTFLRMGSVAEWIEHQTMNTWMTPQCGFKPPWCKISATLLMPLNKALYSNCSVVQRSRKAVGPVYMNLNINTSMHVKERHRLFEKSRGSSRYCWLYFKTTLIYSRLQSMGQRWLWPVWVPFA